MKFFSDDAIYEPGDGKTHRGRPEIRAAFEPQSHGAFGAMRFDEHDRLIDAENRKVAIRWICRHDLSHFRSHGLGNSAQVLIVRLLLGKTFSWHGVDILHLNADALIEEKYSYGWFGSRPHLQRSLAPG